MLLAYFSKPRSQRTSGAVEAGRSVANGRDMVCKSPQAFADAVGKSKDSTRK